MRLTNCNLIECGPSRTRSRSVSWNASGSHLAMATSDGTVRVWTLDAATAGATGASTTASSNGSSNNSHNTSSGGGAREVSTLTGHTAPVLMVHCHPSVDHLVASACQEDVVLLWDVRSSSGGATTQPTARLDGSNGKAPIVSTQWHPTDAHILAVTTRHGTVSVYDTRRLSSTTSTTSTTATSTLATTSLAPDIVDTCIFDATGDHLILGTTRKRTSYGMGHVTLWHWKQTATTESTNKTITNTTALSTFPAHAGPVYAMASSRDGACLVTGGSDALVGVWHAPTMTCVQTMSNSNKWIRSLALSLDHALVAVATEEGVDVGPIKATTHRRHEPVGGPLVSVGSRSSRGAEGLAFHPTAHYILACARLDSVAPVTVLKLSLTF